jgi:hypothetical protein
VFILALFVCFAASGSKTLLAAKGTACSLSVALHPLVVLHISDHWTRARAQNNNSAVDIIGALLGRQNGRDVELVNAYECPYDVISGERVVNMELLNIREQQCLFSLALSFIFTFRQGSVSGIGSSRMVCHRC